MYPLLWNSRFCHNHISCSGSIWVVHVPGPSNIVPPSRADTPLPTDVKLTAETETGTPTGSAGSKSDGTNLLECVNCGRQASFTAIHCTTSMLSQASPIFPVLNTACATSVRSAPQHMYGPRNCAAWCCACKCERQEVSGRGHEPSLKCATNLITQAKLRDPAFRFTCLRSWHHV
jgi:hypothetical protein